MLQPRVREVTEVTCGNPEIARGGEGLRQSITNPKELAQENRTLQRSHK